MKVKKVRMVLVLAPKTVLGAWENEAKNFLPKFAKNVRIQVVHGQPSESRKKIIRNAWKASSTDKPHVIISTWGLACAPRTIDHYIPPTSKGMHWDYVILDEAHAIKNHNSPRAKCCQKICHKRGTKRFLLTGTPFMNNTDEVWSIMRMATGNKVFGKQKEFNTKYGKPIKNARCRNASRFAERHGDKANNELQEKMKPYILRRLKQDHLAKELPALQETCVWTKASNEQIKLYKRTTESYGSLASNLLSADTKVAREARGRCAFKLIPLLLQICNHPLLLEDGDLSAVLEKRQLSAIIQGSKKLELSIHMLKEFKANGHKVLLFCHSTQNLNIIQYVLLKLGSYKVCRLDG